MKSRPLRNFHLPLSDDLYGRLKNEAKRYGQPATSVARHAIEAWLEQRRRIELHDAIAAYSAAVAGTAADLDPDLEKAALDHWRELEG